MNMNSTCGQLTTTLLTTMLLLLWQPSHAVATDFQMPPTITSAEKGDSKNKKKRLTKASYQSLVKVQKAIDKNHYNEAFERLNRLIVQVKDKAYESAVVIRTAAYIYVNQQETNKAVQLLSEALSLNALTKKDQQKLRYDIAQLLISEQEVSEQQYKKAIQSLTLWLDYAHDEDMTASVYAQIGSHYRQLKQYSSAILYLNKAIEKSDQQGKKPSEYHYQLLLACYLAKNKLDEAINVLKRLITNFNLNKNYHLQLVGLYDEINHPNQALAALDITYKLGLLNETSEYTALAQRLMSAGYPHKATQVLHQGLDQFIVWVTPENLTLLAVAYIQAQEPQQAVPILEKALITTTTAVPGQLLSQIYMEQKHWQKATKTLKFTLEKADKKARPELQISLGYALYEQGKIDEAKALFKTLAGNIYLNDEVKHTVQNWNRYFQSL
jgi:tetratricopeptide (TPR) repeat protein